jgi:hypothetical protein
LPTDASADRRLRGLPRRRPGTDASEGATTAPAAVQAPSHLACPLFSTHLRSAPAATHAFVVGLIPAPSTPARFRPSPYHERGCKRAAGTGRSGGLEVAPAQADRRDLRSVTLDREPGPSADHCRSAVPEGIADNSQGPPEKVRATLVKLRAGRWRHGPKPRSQRRGDCLINLRTTAGRKPRRCRD